MSSQYHKRFSSDKDLKPQFQSLVESNSVSFGDGGEATLSYPVEACFPLGGSPTRWQGLAAEISRLAALRQDVQQNTVVEDIVDPELYPRYRTVREQEENFAPTLERDPNQSSDIIELKRVTLNNSHVRGSYTWIPARVGQRVGGVKAEGTMQAPSSASSWRFLSPIQNLPRTIANETLYEYLEEALEEMMPTLIRLGAKSRTDGSYNVSVKLQRYKVPPKACYTGQWHTEGVTEDVSAASVLYTEWPEELQGGALKFRPVNAPDTNYRERCFSDTCICDMSIECKTGTAVAFSNTIPHRFERLTNPTSATLVRSFVNFFVTSPDLPATDEVPTNADIYLALIRQINHDVLTDILSFLKLTPVDWPTALKLRSQAKAEMTANPGKWGMLHYGNCGNVQWISDDAPYTRKEAFEKDVENAPEGDLMWAIENQFKDTLGRDKYVCWNVPGDNPAPEEKLKRDRFLEELPKMNFDVEEMSREELADLGVQIVQWSDFENTNMVSNSTGAHSIASNPGS